MEFLTSPAKVENPIAAETLSGDVLPVKQSVFAGRVKAVAAARSTRLRPIHFIHFIAASVPTAALTSLEVRHYYKIVIFGKPKFLVGKGPPKVAPLIRPRDNHRKGGRRKHC